MDNLRYLLAAIVGLTLIMSVVSGVNPNYFAGMNAFADEHEDEDDDNSGSSNGDNEEHDEDDDNSGSGSDDEEDDDEHDEEDEQDNDDSEDDNEDKEKEKDDDEDKLVQTLGNNSKATLEVDDDAELQVEIEDGDLDDGTYDIMFACDSPDVDEEFADALDVEDGEGEFEEDLPLANGTYTGCEVEVGDLSATFPSFTVMASDDHDDEDDDDNNGRGGHDRERKEEHKLKVEDDGVEVEVEVEGLNMTDGSYDAIFACEEPDFNMTLNDAFDVEEGEGKLEEMIGLENGTYTGCEITVEGDVLASFRTFTVSEDSDDEQEHRIEEKRKEKEERIVTTINGTTIHERHRSQNAASPGEYDPGWDYNLLAAGTANETDATVDIDLGVWKSNRAVILLDVIGGTVEIENQTYTVVLGYALHSISHDTFRVGALAVDDDGNVYKLKMRGSAVNDEAEFPTESGSIELTFDGSSSNRFGDWELTMDCTITAS